MNIKFFHKVGSAVLAAAIVVNTSAISGFLTTSAEAVKYEFEDGTYTTDSVFGSSISGYSGTGYVDSQEGDVSLTINVDSTDIYELTIGYCLPDDRGNKTQNLLVNGVDQGQINFSTTGDGFSEITISSIKLTAGENTVTLKKSWGWTIYDYLTVDTATLPTITASKSLSDKNASESTQRLMSYLVDTYGENIISGQQEYYGSSRDDEFEYIYNLSGEYPAIRGFDFGETCPLYAWDAGAAERAISWVNKGGIATASWHINVPTTMAEYTLGSTMAFDKTTYSEKTDFVTANVMVEGTVEHDYFLLAVENLAAELQKLSDADVPLIFRPFHEAEGNGGTDGSGAWFWWSKEGSSTYKELYKYLYDILTNEYGLHNLIWEFNSYTYENSYDWYPGTEYVDIVAYDKYNAHNWTTGTTAPNESAIASTFYSLVSMYGGDNKMIAMSENDTIPNVENLTTEKAAWLYFMPWYGEHLMDTNYNNADTLTSIYQSDYVITLDELPNLKTYPLDTTDPDVTTTTTTVDPSITTTTTTADPSITTTTTTTEPSFTVQKYTVDVKDVDRTNTLVLEFEGTPNASTNGCIGYTDSDGEWATIEWEASLDADGIGSYVASIADVPASAETVEVQIWWAATWDAANKVNIIAENALSGYKFNSTSGVLYGDVNCDGEVKVADSILILQYIADSSKYTISAEGLINGDVYLTGDGINAQDALSIQKFKANQISVLPESSEN